MLSEAFVAVDGPALGRLEWNITFLSAVRAGRLVHLQWSTVEAAPLAVIHFFLHSLYIRPPYGARLYGQWGGNFLPLNLCMFLYVARRTIIALFHKELYSMFRRFTGIY